MIGRKGTGKTAIFRKLATDADAVVVTSPTGTETHHPWTPDGNFYSALAEELGHRGLEWRQAWPVIIGLSILRCRPGIPTPGWATGNLGAARDGDTYQQFDLLRDLRTLLQHPDAPLFAAEWLQRIDRASGRQHLLLFDALDTGFGNTATDRRRRADGVSGLLTVWANRRRSGPT